METGRMHCKPVDPEPMNYTTLEPYKCRLNLLTPSGKSEKLQKILTPLLGWVDPSFQLVTICERYDDTNWKRVKLKDKENGRLVTPCLSFMLFARENGALSAQEYQKCFKVEPWSFHHKVELQNTTSPKHPVGKQEFFKLDDDLPLWAVCPSNEERVRINLYVSKFKEMVEFYRAVTNVEMESSKPEFCIFQLYQQPGLVIQLSLKYSPFLHPVRVESACLSFNIQDVRAVRSGTSCHVEKVDENAYSALDPDGNIVLLYEMSPTVGEPVAGMSCEPGFSKGLESADDLKSSSDSHDSGRCSDLEVTSSEIELTKGHKQPSGTLRKGGSATSDKGKALTKRAGARPVPKKGTVSINQLSPSEAVKQDSSGTSNNSGRFTPVYI